MWKIKENRFRFVEGYPLIAFEIQTLNVSQKFYLVSDLATHFVEISCFASDIYLWYLAIEWNVIIKQNYYMQPIGNSNAVYRYCATILTDVQEWNIIKTQSNIQKFQMNGIFPCFKHFIYFDSFVSYFWILRLISHSYFIFQKNIATDCI